MQMHANTEKKHALRTLTNLQKYTYLSAHTHALTNIHTR